MVIVLNYWDEGDVMFYLMHMLKSILTHSFCYLFNDSSTLVVIYLSVDGLFISYLFLFKLVFCYDYLVIVLVKLVFCSDYWVIVLVRLV